MLDTADLKNALLQDYHDLKAGKITRSEARARASVAKNAIDLMKIEIMAASANLKEFEPVQLYPTDRLKLRAA